MRTLFDKPVRYTTLEFFKNPMNIGDFQREIENNIFHYSKERKEYWGSKKRNIEEWVEEFLAWAEIEQE